MLYLPFISLLIYAIIYRANNRRYGAVNLLFTTYVSSLGLGAVAHGLGIQTSVFSIDTSAMVYLTVVLLVMFFGFSSYRERKFRTFQIENVQMFKFLENFSLLSGLFALIFYTPFAIVALTGDINMNRLNNSELIESFGSFGLVNSFAALFANLFLLSQSFFFLRLIAINRPKRDLKKYLLLLSSLSYIVYNFAFVGRDGVVLWIMSLLFQYFFFRDFLSKKNERYLKKIGLVLVLVMSIPFMAISISRFGNSERGTIWYILNYFYQGSKNFNDQILIEAPLQYGRFNFRVVTDFLDRIGISVSEGLDKDTFTSIYRSKGVDPWTFSFWFGMILRDFGRIGTLFFMVFFSYVPRRLIEKTNWSGIMKFSDYVLWILYYQIVFYGIFYFRYFSANWYLIFMFLLWFVLRGFGSGRKLSYVKQRF